MTPPTTAQQPYDPLPEVPPYPRSGGASPPPVAHPVPLRLKGEWMARGDIPFLMLMEPGLTLALRTPFQRLPKESERAKYMQALEGGRTSL